ncbi:putative baseplate assembly protein [Amycolatopsis mongoliensis]|uniref:Baseplate assembly protein n=1 Tax=Amycolatopsis mongoliensis TaxID=715475 RepID=A0A9Y2NGZ9_9PSEU|nr:putative baseplate assembly protein [Amycolatopsis sp. 4-36]WIX99177.1 putative baseplate assembly protein [Amycolatopsis sp. 4-36]
MTVKCDTDARRSLVRAARLNGIDEVEVDDSGTLLTVTFLGRAPEHLKPHHIRIDGGRRITGLVATEVEVEAAEDPDLDDRVHVTVNGPGDSSVYTLNIVEPDAFGRPGTRPYHGFDARYTSATFSFRLACPTDFDCAAGEPAARPAHPAPPIDYLARDYGTLRRLLLDRATLTVPQWIERHEPDLALAVLELFAYLGDQFSYQQDAVATEAYLGTARRRQSVRRHVRLIDYAMHDGCNARAWVVLSTDREVELAAGDFRFAAIDLSRLDPAQRPAIPTVLDDEELENLSPAAGIQVFEPLPARPLRLWPQHTSISFWTWGEQECFLPKGTTTATLRDDHDAPLQLCPGDVLVIEEVLGPKTGSAADADPAHRQAVRVTAVKAAVDKLFDQPLVDVTWADEDALTFPVCLSSRGGPECRLLTDVSVARGNVVLTDHGRDITHCGGAPEVILVPPAPVAPPNCAPPALGCPDRPGNDPAVVLIHGLITRTQGGTPLDDEEITLLVPLLGQAAVDRAKLTADLTAAEQAAALEALLAQVTYPQLRRRFRPRPRYAPITQRAPFPTPAWISLGQSRLLATLPGRVRGRLDHMRRAVADGRQLSAAEIEELTRWFGTATLARYDIRRHPAAALHHLIARFDEFLAAELARLATLVGRAGAGEVLGDDVGWEIGQAWGPDFGEELAADSPRLAGPAGVALHQDPRDARPALEIRDEDDRSWGPKRDLLASGPTDRDFVGELTDDGSLEIRFGDGQHGRQPTPGTEITLHYRVGDGLAGNVGAEAISHIVLCCGAGDGSGITVVRNPLPATGGVDPEPLDQVRQLAPLALHRTRLRAVTATDYADLAGQVPGVQRAAAEIRWTGTGQEVHVAIDALGTESVSPALLDTVAARLAAYRRIGLGLVVLPAVLVPLDVEVTLCVATGYQRAHVSQAVRLVLRRMFAPDELTFGDPARVSRIVTAAGAVPGVQSVQVTRLKRLFRPAAGELDAGVLVIGPLEIAQLDDDRDRPENGRLAIVAGGGR